MAVLDPQYLIGEGYFETGVDFEDTGRQVLVSRLGYRITKRFVLAFFGLMFNHPAALFTEQMLRPELQDMEIFIDGLDNIVSTQKRIAQRYFNDGSVELACPPLRALLHIMSCDHFEGRVVDHSEIRALFTRENMLSSDWYAERLAAKQNVDIRH